MPLSRMTGGGGGIIRSPEWQEERQKVWVQFPARSKTFRNWNLSRVAEGQFAPQWIADQRSFVAYWPDYAAESLSPFSAEVSKAWNCIFTSYPSSRRGVRGSDGFALTHTKARDLVRCGGRSYRKGYESTRRPIWTQGIKVNDKTFMNI